MVFQEINGRHHSTENAKALSVLLKEIISVISLNMVAHLLIVHLVKAGIPKRF